MRFYLLASLCMFALVGCVNYVGMHSRSTPLTVSALNTPHVYKTNNKSIAYVTPVTPTFKDKQLNNLIAIALCRSPDMKIAQDRVQRAKEIAMGSAALMWPSIDANGYVQRQRFSQAGLVPPPFNGKTFNIQDIALNFNYEFDFWGKNRETVAARVSEECARQADLAEARLIIATAVASAYFQLQSNLVQLRLAQAIYQQQNQILTIVRDRALHGIESDIPLKTATADADSARLAVEQYRQAEKISRNQLAVLLGNNPFTTSIATNQYSFKKYVVPIPDMLPANLLAHRPDVMAARLRTEAAAHEVKMAKARFYPNINLSALFSYQKINFGNLFNPAYQNNAISGAFDLPIFDAGERRANLGVRYAEYDEAVNTYNQTILSALQDVADQGATLQALSAQLRSQQSALAATEHNYKLMNSRYNHGIADYLQVLEVKGTLLQERATQANLQARYLLSTVAMIKALGGEFGNLTGQG